MGLSEDADPEDGEERFIGWSAMEGAAREGHLAILKRLGPDPARDDFDNLYRYAKYESIIAFLATIQPPKDLTSILSWHLWWLGDRFPWAGRRGTGTIEALVDCGVRWEESNLETLTEIRRSLLRVGDYDLKTILSRLRRPEICAPETYQELIRTPRMQERTLALGLVKKPVSKREQRRGELARLYEQVWSQPVQDVADRRSNRGVAGCRPRNAPAARTGSPSADRCCALLRYSQRRAAGRPLVRASGR